MEDLLACGAPLPPSNSPGVHFLQALYDFLLLSVLLVLSIITILMRLYQKAQVFSNLGQHLPSPAYSGTYPHLAPS